MGINDEQIKFGPKQFQNRMNSINTQKIVMESNEIPLFFFINKYIRKVYICK